MVTFMFVVEDVECMCGLGRLCCV